MHIIKWIATHQFRYPQQSMWMKDLLPMFNFFLRMNGAVAAALLLEWYLKTVIDIDFWIETKKSTVFSVFVKKFNQ